MSKIDIPQVIVTYPAGCGGEWLAYQLGLHDKYYNEEIKVKEMENNRFRLKHSWRSRMLDDGEIQSTIWTERPYDGSQDWWDYYNSLCEKNGQQLVDTITDMIANGKPRFKIPVHRSHEGWHDVFFSKLFTEYKIVIFDVDQNDDSFEQFKSNVIKKIWWQDLSSHYDFDMEIVDKWKKHTNREGYHEIFGTPLLNEKAISQIYYKMDLPINYTDMMFVLYWSQYQGDARKAIKECMSQLQSKWDSEHLQQYNIDLPGQDTYRVSYKRLIVDREYTEYVNLCEFLEIKPWEEQKWMDTVNPYSDTDKDQFISVSDVEKRLYKRAEQITGERYDK
ncbi:hypothetical protein N8072_01035 [bacterium]|nr:hypothetical protein [bacterium]MDB4128615.1 hypothetical protein [bacterium]MDC1257245.1 hypothetical protein [bacterium]